MEKLKKLVEQRNQESLERAIEFEEKFNERLNEFEKTISKRINKCILDMEKRFEECSKNMTETKVEVNKKIEQQYSLFKENMHSLKTDINTAVSGFSEQMGAIQEKTSESARNETRFKKSTR